MSAEAGRKGDVCIRAIDRRCEPVAEPSVSSERSQSKFRNCGAAVSAALGRRDACTTNYSPRVSNARAYFRLRRRTAVNGRPMKGSKSSFLHPPRCEPGMAAQIFWRVVVLFTDVLVVCQT